MNNINSKRFFLCYFPPLFLILLLFLLLISPTNFTYKDQSSKPIINGYKLLTVSAYDKCIGFELDNGSTKIGTYVPGHVYKYCFNSIYIGIQQIKPAKTKDELDYTSVHYIIINTTSDTIYSFRSKSEFDDFIMKYDVSNLSDWIETTK